MLPATLARFCHRGTSPDVVSPGAVSRFGLVPVHGDRHEFDLRFVGTATSSFELCNDYTTRGHTPRALVTSLREARPKGRITLPPRTHRLAPVEGDSERCTHESRRVRLATCFLGVHRPGDIESRALPRRKGSSPGSTMSRAPVGHRLRPRAAGDRAWKSRSVEASHMHRLPGARRCYPPWSACREATRPS